MQKTTDPLFNQHKLYVTKIIKHSFRGGHTKLYTIWGPYEVEMWEEIETLIDERKGLINYLKQLKENKPRKHANLVKRHRDLPIRLGLAQQVKNTENKNVPTKDKSSSNQHKPIIEDPTIGTTKQGEANNDIGTTNSH